MKILCVLISNFFLGCETAVHPGLTGRRLLVVYGAGSRKLVLDWSPELTGIWKDMPLNQALAVDDKVELIQADLPMYLSVFNRIMNGLESCVSPLVEGSDPGIIYLEAGGLELIFPDNDSLAGAIRGILPDVFNVRIGIAGGKFPAYLAALNSRTDGYRVPGDDMQFVRKLSCDVLPVSVNNKVKLHAFGIHTLGQLADFPAGPLQAQFGTEGVKMKELAQGIDTAPLIPRKAEEIIEESVMLNSVTTSIDTLMVTVESLLSRVFSRILEKGMGIADLVIWTRTFGAEHWERVIHFKEPSMNLKNALIRVRRLLENFPQSGPVEQTGIRVVRLGYPRGKQNNLFTEVRSKNHLMEDIRQLELRQGNPQVFTIREVEPWSRIPERRYTLMPAGR